MATIPVMSVDEYLAAQPRAVRAVLARVRRAIRQALPEAEEGISYRIPAYRLRGRPVLYFAGWARHYSLYPATRALVRALAKDLGPYELGKGTIRFPLTEPVPVRLIARIARHRAQEAGTRARRQRIQPRKARRAAAGRA